MANIIGKFDNIYKFAIYEEEDNYAINVLKSEFKRGNIKLAEEIFEESPAFFNIEDIVDEYNIESFIYIGTYDFEIWDNG